MVIIVYRQFNNGNKACDDFDFNGDIHTPICILIGTYVFAYFIGVLTTVIAEEAQLFCAFHRISRQVTHVIVAHIRHCNYKCNNYINTNSIIIQPNQYTFPTAPSFSACEASKSPTKPPIVAANIVQKSIFLFLAGDSFDGTYISNGTFDIGQIFIKKYLLQSIRAFIYLILFYYSNETLLYRDYHNNLNNGIVKESKHLTSTIQNKIGADTVITQPNDHTYINLIRNNTQVNIAPQTIYFRSHKSISFSKFIVTTAPRGVPQIEIAFDSDANGILSSAITDAPNILVMILDGFSCLAWTLIYIVYHQQIINYVSIRINTLNIHCF